jgi:hypothetical protein
VHHVGFIILTYFRQLWNSVSCSALTGVPIRKCLPYVPSSRTLACAVHAMTQAPIRRLLANKVRVPCKVCGWQCGIGVGPSLSLSVCPCKFSFHRCSTPNSYPAIVQRMQTWDCTWLSRVNKQRLLAVFFTEWVWNVPYLLTYLLHGAESFLRS